MSPYNVFIVSGDPDSNAIVNLIFSINEINSAIDFIEKIILGDEDYYSNNTLIHNSMNRSNNYIYIGNTKIVDGKICHGYFGGFIIQEIIFLENWTDKEKDDYLENPPLVVWNGDC
jgi:hypothetical protein